MKETTPAAMPPCFERWCQRFEALWTNKPLNSFTVDALAASRRVAIDAFRTAMYEPIF